MHICLAANRTCLSGSQESISAWYIGPLRLIIGISSPLRKLFTQTTSLTNVQCSLCSLRLKVILYGKIPLEHPTASMHAKHYQHNGSFIVMEAETKKRGVPPNFYQPSRAQELPPEVLDIILSCFLDTTKQTLASCSLVCKHWLSNARRYLFRTIIIRLQDGWTNQEILGFLTNSPDRRWIKNIVIRGWWSRPLKLSFLAACLSKLPTKLHSLSLVDLALDCYESQSESLGNPPAIEVETLELSQMDTPAIRLIETISIFSEIETLVIHGGSDWARRFPEGRGVPMGRPFSLGSPSDDMGIIEQRTIRGLRAGR